MGKFFKGVASSGAWVSDNVVLSFRLALMSLIELIWRCFPLSRSKS
jgi:hypothetical protein